MRILISGSSGLVGNALRTFLVDQGHHVVRLVRSVKELAADTILWDPMDGSIDVGALEGFDGVVHLSGENIASGRWNKKRKEKILTSRVKSTQVLSKALAQLKRPPKAYIVASAVGIYGDRGSSYSHEKTPPNSGFLANVCKQWEEATLPASEKGIRTVNLRLGVVLSPKGGVLGKILPIFKLGLGGTIGNGRQYMSWIAIDDVVAIIRFALTHEGLRGPVNAVSPYPETNAVFTKTLAAILKKPAFLPVPAFILRWIFGREMANEVFLSSSRVEPLRLTEAGYTFQYTVLEGALRHLLNIHEREGR